MASGFPNATWLAAAIAVVAYGAFAFMRLQQLDFDPSGFVVAGDAFVDASSAPAALRVLPHSPGYDGVFFYRLALDPFTTTRTDFGITLDAPAYRQQRILYPLLGWALSAGHASWVPAALIAVNGLGIAAIAWLAAVFCQRAGRHALWGTIVAFHPGFLFSLARDLSEITAIACVLAGLVCWQRARLLPAGIALSLAVLARETTLLVPIALLLGSLPKKPNAWLLLPTVVLVGWHLALWQIWGAFPFEASTALALPFSGIGAFASAYLPPGPGAEQAYVAGAAYLACIVALSASSVRARAPNAALLVGWLIYLALGCCYSFSVWVEDVSFLRASSELQLLCVLRLATAGGSRRTLAAAGVLTITLWLVLAIARHF